MRFHLWLRAGLLFCCLPSLLCQDPDESGSLEPQEPAVRPPIQNPIVHTTKLIESMRLSKEPQEIEDKDGTIPNEASKVPVKLDGNSYEDDPAVIDIGSSHEDTPENQVPEDEDSYEDGPRDEAPEENDNYESQPKNESAYDPLDYSYDPKDQLLDDAYSYEDGPQVPISKDGSSHEDHPGNQLLQDGNEYSPKFFSFEHGNSSEINESDQSALITPENELAATFQLADETNDTSSILSEAQEVEDYTDTKTEVPLEGNESPKHVIHIISHISVTNLSENSQNLQVVPHIAIHNHHYSNNHQFQQHPSPPYEKKSSPDLHPWKYTPASLPLFSSTVTDKDAPPDQEITTENTQEPTSTLLESTSGSHWRSSPSTTFPSTTQELLPEEKTSEKSWKVTSRVSRLQQQPTSTPVWWFSPTTTPTTTPLPSASWTGAKGSCPDMFVEVGDLCLWYNQVFRLSFSTAFKWCRDVNLKPLSYTLYNTGIRHSLGLRDTWLTYAHANRLCVFINHYGKVAKTDCTSLKYFICYFDRREFPHRLHYH